MIGYVKLALAVIEQALRDFAPHEGLGRPMQVDLSAVYAAIAKLDRRISAGEFLVGHAESGLWFDLARTCHPSETRHGEAWRRLVLRMHAERRRLLTLQKTLQQQSLASARTYRRGRTPSAA